MKLLFLLSLFSLEAFGQDNNELARMKRWPGWREQTIYIFCRGTRSKSGIMARQFNRTDSNSTHVGIGFFEKGQARIFHISDEAGIDNALKVGPLDIFLSRSDIYYFSVWQIPATGDEFRAFRSALVSFSRRKISFDMRFRLDNGDSLYCSEFCAIILQRTSARFYVRPVHMQVTNKLYQLFLGRNDLWYYPVDFFQTPNARKVYEFRMKQ